MGDEGCCKALWEALPHWAELTSRAWCREGRTPTKTPKEGGQTQGAQFCPQPSAAFLEGAILTQMSLEDGNTAEGSPIHPSPPHHHPHAAVCYLTTDTDIQRGPPSDPHPAARPQGAHCSRPGGSRAAGPPGHAEEKR